MGRKGARQETTVDASLVLHVLQQTARIRNHSQQFYRHLNEPYTSVLGD